MGVLYKSIAWNRQKKIYDGILAILAGAYLITFNVVFLLVNPGVTTETLIIRSTGSLAILLLHVILVIGPLCRLAPVFLPMLYNRRHLGVTMFLVAGVHGIFSLVQFHGKSNEAVIVSLFTANVNYGSFIYFPFEVFGFTALVILLLMAVSSHDFWLNSFSPRVWKALHMLVYVAYSSVILHVLLGVLVNERASIFTLLLIGGVVLVVALHLVAGFAERRKDKREEQLDSDAYVRACHVDDIMEDRARIVNVNGDRVAIFKYDGKLSAVSNVCKHQHGPLGEGRIIDGCITCPWHGYQYLPENGCSPPPFKEKIETYALFLSDDGDVWVNPKANPEGTPQRPVYLNQVSTQ